MTARANRTSSPAGTMVPLGRSVGITAGVGLVALMVGLMAGGGHDRAGSSPGAVRVAGATAASAASLPERANRGVVNLPTDAKPVPLLLPPVASKPSVPTPRLEPTSSAGSEPARPPETARVDPVPATSGTEPARPPETARVDPVPATAGDRAQPSEVARLEPVPTPVVVLRGDTQGRPAQGGPQRVVRSGGYYAPAAASFASDRNGNGQLLP